MTRLMYDSTNPYDIPRTAVAVAGYVDGAYAWPQAGWDWHGAPLKLRITVFGDDLSAHCADIEAGTMTIEKGVQWALAKRARGDLPALYFSRGLSDQVNAALVAAGFKGNDVTFWLADWTGVAHLLPGTFATQYADPAFGSGGHYDLSMVGDFWPGVDVPAPPGPGSARDVLLGIIRQQTPAFLTRADIAAAWAAGRQNDVFGEWLKETQAAFWARADIVTAWAAGRFDDVIGEFVKEFQAAPPAPAPSPAPSPLPVGPPLDQVRASWAQLGDLLNVAAPGFMTRLAAAVDQLRKLP